MSAAIRQYRAIQALALRAETHELATVGCVGHRPEPEPVLQAEPHWLAWLWVAMAVLPCAMAILFLLTDFGKSAAVAIWSY